MPINDPFGQGFSSLDYGEAPDLKVMGEGLLKIVGQTTMRFATATARNAVITSPVEGMRAWLNDSNMETVYDGSAWHQVPLIVTSTVISTQASMPASFTVGAFTDFASGNWAPAVATVPPSGKVAISVGAACQNTNTSTATAWAAWRSTGALIEAASEANGVSTWGSRTYATRRVIRTGLTPGATLTVIPRYLLSSVGTIGVETRVSDGQLSVEPLFA